jgi:hypothetical protein
MTQHPAERRQPTARKSVIAACVCFVILMVIIGEPWLVMSSKPEGISATNNMKQLVFAMHEYTDFHKRMPAAAIFDKNGRALLNWRVLVLPQLEERGLYYDFHLDEPWDSKDNLSLLSRMPGLYAPEKVAKVDPYHTFFKVFVGTRRKLRSIKLIRKPLLPNVTPPVTANTVRDSLILRFNTVPGRRSPGPALQMCPVGTSRLAK